MSTRTKLSTALAVLALAGLLIVGTAPIAFGGLAGQTDPTAEQQTINAIVEQRFTQTAAAQQQVGLTQTAEAAVVSGPTLTAAFNATVDAAFNQVLTATAQASVAQTVAARGLELISAQTAARLEVLTTTEKTISNVTSLAFGPDGKTMVVGCEGGVLVLFDAVTGAEVRELSRQSSDDISAVAFSPAGTLVASATAASRGSLRLWDAATGMTVREFDAGPVSSLAFSPDGTMLAVGHRPAESQFGVVTLWDVASGTEIRHFTADESDVHALAFNPAGTLLASGGNNMKARLWDATSGRMVKELPGHTAAIASLAFSPDGTRLAASAWDGTALVWLIDTGAILATLSTGANEINSVAFSPDGTVVAVGYGRNRGGVMLWDTATSAVLAAPEVPGGGVRQIAFSPDGAVLATANERLRLWGVRASPPVTETPVPTVTAEGPRPSATALPPLFPTVTAAQVQIAEQVFEHGRMFWIRHTRQIWVMVNVPSDNSGGGDWYCYNDTFQEGEPETDPALVPPEGLIQPRRGFGKLWRTHADLNDGLGWALTPEFELNSAYTYIAGGYVENNQYFPGPGEHRLTTLYNQSISFFESDIQGDCLGGTWRMTQ